MILVSLISFALRQTVTIKPYLREGAGESIYGPAEQRRCRLERGKNLKTVYKNPSGQIDQIVASAKMFCEGPPIPPRSIVIFENERYTVINCYVANGFKDHHLEVYLE